MSFRKEQIKKFNSLETPFYYYDLELLKKTLGELTKESSKRNFKIHYALKANSNDRILKLINDAEGLAFIAHPGNINEKILLSLIKYGLDGIEVVHPSHNPTQVKFYRGIVNEFYLLASGVSD